MEKKNIIIQYEHMERTFSHSTTYRNMQFSNVQDIFTNVFF